MYFTMYMTCWAGFTAVNKALDTYDRSKVDSSAPPEDNTDQDPPDSPPPPEGK
jgi:hypothetical protein